MNLVYHFQISINKDLHQYGGQESPFHFHYFFAYFFLFYFIL